MMFGEYFPNPGTFPHPDQLSAVTLLDALLVEAWATCVLAFVIFALTDQHNTATGRDKVAVPALIGATVSVLVSLYAPLTQAGMNPARDLGPRVFAAMAGWGTVALPGPRGGFWVYVVGPIVGALVGAALYDLVVSKVVRTLLSQRIQPVDVDRDRRVN